jgi:3-methyladenine DNA glycosylase AlkD
MAKAAAPVAAREVLAELEAMGSEANRAAMARYGINIEKAFGVSMAAQRPLARKYRRDHALALALWASGYHEARILAALIEDPKQVTPRQMDNWAADFGSSRGRLM